MPNGSISTHPIFTWKNIIEGDLLAQNSLHDHGSKIPSTSSKTIPENLNRTIRRLWPFYDRSISAKMRILTKLSAQNRVPKMLQIFLEKNEKIGGVKLIGD